jgi:hypothetical protein
MPAWARANRPANRAQRPELRLASSGGHAVQCNRVPVAWAGTVLLVGLPEHSGTYVRTEAAEASYGWGAIPLRARIGATEWETSLLPKNGGYLLPVKAAVREREQFGDGDMVTVAQPADHLDRRARWVSTRSVG